MSIFFSQFECKAFRPYVCRVIAINNDFLKLIGGILLCSSTPLIPKLEINES